MKNSVDNLWRLPGLTPLLRSDGEISRFKREPFLDCLLAGRGIWEGYSQAKDAGRQPRTKYVGTMSARSIEGGQSGEILPYMFSRTSTGILLGMYAPSSPSTFEFRRSRQCVQGAHFPSMTRTYAHVQDKWLSNKVNLRDSS